MMVDVCFSVALILELAISMTTRVVRMVVALTVDVWIQRHVIMMQMFLVIMAHAFSSDAHLMLLAIMTLMPDVMMVLVYSLAALMRLLATLM